MKAFNQKLEVHSEQKDKSSQIEVFRLPSERGNTDILKEILDFSGIGFVAQPMVDKRFCLQQRGVVLSATSRSLPGGLHATLERLGLPAMQEVYVLPDPQYQAFVLDDSLGEGYILGLSARLLEDFSEAQLQFVIGHELAHLAFGHTQLQARLQPLLEHGPRDPRLALRVQSLKRQQELSCDRIGLLCSQDLEAGIAAFCMLSTGTSNQKIRAEEYLEQDQKYMFFDEEIDGYAPWKHSHPPLHVRVQALKAFAESLKNSQWSELEPEHVAMSAVNNQCELLLDSLERDDCKVGRANVEQFRKAITVLTFRVCAAEQSEMDHTHELVSLLNSKVLNVALGPPEEEESIEFLRQHASRGRRIRFLEFLCSVAAQHRYLERDICQSILRIARALQISESICERQIISTRQRVDYWLKNRVTF